MNYTTQVGGVSDGRLGAAAMNLSTGTLHHVLNFWVFADRFYVHLGAGLGCTTASPVVTSMANRLLGDGRSVVVSSSGGEEETAQNLVLPHGNHSWDDVSTVEWVWHQSNSGVGAASADTAAPLGVAYLPLQAKGASKNAALHVNNRNRSGDWSELGTNHGKVTAATLEIQLHYGTCDSFGAGGESKGQFAYAVMPEVTQASLRAKKPHPWTILSNSPKLQAVAHKSAEGASIVQAAFWAQGVLPATASTLGLSVPSPGGMLVLVRRSADGSVALTVSGPWGPGAASVLAPEVTVTGRYSGRNCTLSSDGTSTTLALCESTEQQPPHNQPFQLNVSAFVPPSAAAAAAPGATA